MNDHIRRLAGQALDQAVPQTWTTLTADDLNKFTEVFAELLIRECLNTCTDVENEALQNQEYKAGSVATLIKVLIKDHFGVKS